MKPENFCYWLRGYLELSHEDALERGLSPQQVKIVSQHLSLVLREVPKDGSEPLVFDPNIKCVLTC
jgi:hypothetical protein